MKRFLSLIVALVMVLSMGCVVAAEEANLAGVYMVDGSPLGMPLTIYLTIDENNHFQWTNKLVDGVDKGNGQIGMNDGLYIMLYSDSTSDALKTATFTTEGANLVFSTRIPYGAAGFSPNTEDENNIIYPVAQKMIYTEYLGEYVGALEVSAMGSAIVYNVELTLNYGAAYTLVSTFEMGGETYTYEQAGSFAIEDGAITLTCEGKAAQVGTVAEDGITVAAFLSAMGSSPREIALKKAITAEVAGVYTGVKDLSAMGVYANTTLTLDAVGGYTYVSKIEGEDDYTDEGTFAVDGSTITLTNTEGAVTECTLENHVLAAKMRINAAVPMATAISFYRDLVQGEFTAAGTDEAGSEVSSVLTLNADATYSIAVCADGFDVYAEEGTFTTEASMMGVSLVLTANDGTVSTGVVSDTINITHNVDYAFNTLGFKYTK